MNRKQRIIAVTMGDPAGIGPEIVAASLPRRIGDAAVVVVGDLDAMQRARATLRLPYAVRRIARPEEATYEANTIDVLQVGSLPAGLTMGRIDAISGRASFDYVDRAIDLALAGSVDAIVTAPVNKQAWRAAGIDFPGHTELFAARTGTDDFAMMLFNDEVRVVLVSIHVALREAIELVTVERELRIIRLANKAMRDIGISSPRIGVAGLNPHAGEGGLFGLEDRDIISPAVEAARAEGIDASGPWPGDTVFMKARRGTFDIVVAQYHDQGLIPLKYMGIDNGVNVTLGLPFVRTSVDHGTAFDIAGKGTADPSSLQVALDHAVRMTPARS